MRLWCAAVSGRCRNRKPWRAVISPAATATPDKAIEDLSFEGALKELEAIVSRLEQGAVDLEDSIALYERGQALKSHCEKKLKAAEGRLEKIVLGADGPELSETLERA
ncbi:MAG TPA: exodeoxyribonuclease VII small subunit [Rhizomicrobium sp.]